MATGDQGLASGNKRARGPNHSMEEFRTLGLAIMGRDKAKNDGRTAFARRWKNFFGVKLEIVTHVWDNLLDSQQLLKAGATKKHLLWALLFLRIYDTEATHCRMAACLDEGTFRTWSWFFVDELARLSPTVVRIGLCYCFFANKLP